MSDFLEEINRISEEKEQKNPAQEQPAVSAGLKSVDHPIELDRTYMKRRVIMTLIICISAVAVVFGSILLIRHFTLIKMENFTGKDVAEIKTWCSANKLNFIEDSVFHMETEADSVISQSVETGTAIAPGSTVRAVVSQGPDPEEKIAVPELSAMKAPEIQAWISENRLLNTSIEEKFSDTVPSGGVISCKFSSVTVDKDHFTRKDGLTIYVSKGSETASGISMPLIVGKTRAECEQWAASNGIKDVYVPVFSDTAAEGSVVSQSVAAKSTVQKDDEVKFEVSAGRGIAVPDFSKVSMAEAAERYPMLAVRVVKQYSRDKSYGEFLSQSVSAGTKLPADNTAVTVFYSEGRPFIPNLIGMSESELPALFYEFQQKGASIEYHINYVDSSAPKATVVGASRFSEFVSLKENIIIEVSNGKQPDGDI